MWKYAAAPVAISTVVLGVAYALLYHAFFRLAAPLVGNEWYWRVLYYLLAAVVTVFLLVMIVFLFTLVASAIAGPFNDLISEKTETLVTGVFQETPFSFGTLLKDSGRSILHSFKILGIYLGLLLLGLPVLLIPGAGGLLFSVLGALLSSYILAYEYLGYPMDRRRFSFSEKRRFLRSKFRSVLGFGLGNLAVASIPIVNVLFIPAAVAGGTLLFLDLQPE